MVQGTRYSASLFRKFIQKVELPVREVFCAGGKTGLGVL